MPKRILAVASTTGYQTEMFAEAASRLGIELVLCTDRCHVLENPWGDSALPIRFDAPEEAAELVARQGALDGIVALGDRPAEVAAVIAQRLGIPFHSAEAARACRNKFMARERFRDAGMLVPSFYRVSISDSPGLAASAADYPCVLKPLGLSGSRGVIRANDPDEFAAAFERIRAILRLPEIAQVREEQTAFIQVEEFIPGAEFALEGIVTDGELTSLALFDKPDDLQGPYFEETIYVTPSHQSAEVQRAIVETTQTGVTALGLRHGPVHAEMRVNARGVWMLEIAARPIGGLCARVLPGLPELILKHAAGGAVGTPLALEGATGVMMIPIPREGVLQSVAGVEDASAVPGVDSCVITAKQGQTLLPLPEGSSYLGFLFATGSDPRQVERTLRRAHAKLEFEITAALPVIG